MIIKLCIIYIKVTNYPRGESELNNLDSLFRGKDIKVLGYDV